MLKFKTMRSIAREIYSGLITPNDGRKKNQIR